MEAVFRFYRYDLTKVARKRLSKDVWRVFKANIIELLQQKYASSIIQLQNLHTRIQH